MAAHTLVSAPCEGIAPRDVTPTPTIEARIADLLGVGAKQAAMEIAIGAYGDELRGFVKAVLRDEIAAAEAYAETCARLWSGVGSFRGESSFRTWAYVVARNVVRTQTSRQLRAREAPLSSARTSQLVFRPATTQPSRDPGARLALLREALSPDDQALLVLRVDRALSWDDVARVFESNAPAVRKRFERIKERLRALLREDA